MKKIAIIILALVCLFSSNSFGNLIETDGKNVFVKSNYYDKFYVIDEEDNRLEVGFFLKELYLNYYYSNSYPCNMPSIVDYYVSDGYIFASMNVKCPYEDYFFIYNSYKYAYTNQGGFLIIKINLKDLSHEFIKYPNSINDYKYPKMWVSNGVIYLEFRSFSEEKEVNAIYFYYNSEKKQWIEIDYGSEIILVNKQGILFTRDKRILTSDNKEIDVFKYYRDARFSTSVYNDAELAYNYKFFDFYLRYSDPDTYSFNSISFVGSVLSGYDYDYGYEFFYPQLVKYQGKFVAIDYDPKENVYYRAGQFGTIFRNEEKLESPFGDEVIFIDVCVTGKGVFFLTNDNKLTRFHNGDWHEFNLK